MNIDLTPRPAGAHYAEPARPALVHGSWRGVGRRIAAAGTTAVMVGSLLAPNVALAAEWVEVGGTQYTQAEYGTTGASGEGWSWDGADDMSLTGYNGGAITASGALNITYSGTNTVNGAATVASSEGNDYTGSIAVVDGEKEDASLTIQNSESDPSASLSVNPKEDSSAIRSQGDVTLAGSGTISVDGSCAVYADGEVNITSSGETTLGSESSLVGIVGSGVSISGTGTTNVAGRGAGIFSEGNIDIDGATVNAKASSLTETLIDGYTYGIYADGGNVTIQNGANVTASATNAKEDVSLAAGIAADGISGVGGNIIIKDSTVKATATDTGSELHDAVGILAQGDKVDSTITIENSKVTAEASVSAEKEPSLAYGIFSTAYNANASISIGGSTVSAKGEDAGLLAYSYVSSADTTATGSIAIKNANIVTPTGGLVRDIYNAYDEEHEFGLFGQIVSTSSDGEALENAASEVLIEAEKKEDVTPEPTPTPTPTPDDKKSSDTTPSGTKPASSDEAEAKKASATTGTLAQTGDDSAVAVVAIAIAGAAAISAGAAAARRRRAE